MRMELAQHLADDGRALAELRVGVEVQVVVHGVQDPPLHGLEAVAHVGQGARGDDADGVVQIAPLGLVAEDRVDRHPRAAAVIGAVTGAAPAALLATAAARSACRRRARCGRGAGAIQLELSLLRHGPLVGA